VVAAALRERGWSVIMLEEGSLLRRDVPQEAVDNDSPMAEVRGKHGWEDRGWPWSTRNVGGGTLFYGGASFRYRRCDYDASPWISGLGLDVAWPIGPDDLEPYYALIERRLNVCGGPLDEPLGGRCGPLPMTLPAELMAAAAERMGYQPFSTPMAVNGRSCDLQQHCIDYQCPNGAKGDVVQIYLRQLSADPGFTLLSGIRGAALEQGRADRATGLRCVELASGEVRCVRAGHYFIACNAIQSAALLLRSVTPFSPAGIGNNQDLVGRGLCMKLSQYVRGAMDATPRLRDHPVGLRGPFSTMAILDHYLDTDCPSGMGGLIYEARSLSPSEPIRHLPLDLETIIADTPAYQNRVRLSSNLDRWGMPKIMIDYQIFPRDLARLAYMAERCERILRESGATQAKSQRARSEHGSTHLHGTCRSGADPARSVLDPYCRIHGLENIHVVDGSFMPFPGGLNPTLTIQANALRVALNVVGKGKS